MDIILLERVEKLGAIGDVVTVKDGYARNFLLPNKKALRANAANRKVFEANRAKIESDNASRRDEAQKASGDTIAELERQTRMNEDIIRYMTVRVDKHEVGPSVMMRKSDRPERSERSERGGFGGGDRDRGAPRPDRGDRPDRAPRAEQEA